MNQLTTDNYQTALDQLAQQDTKLEHIYSSLGQPPTWFRPAGFATLVLIILEQQVSLASARASYQKLEQALNITPEQLVQVSEAQFRNLTISRQKAGYLKHLSEAILKGQLDLKALEQQTDEQVRQQLMSIKGIGIWTANIYLLMALGRADVWPKGDLALVKAARQLWQRPDMTQDALNARAEHWQPWRSVAARLLWHYYLNS